MRAVTAIALAAFAGLFIASVHGQRYPDVPPGVPLESWIPMGAGVGFVVTMEIADGARAIAASEPAGGTSRDARRSLGVP